MRTPALALLTTATLLLAACGTTADDDDADPATTESVSAATEPATEPSTTEPAASEPAEAGDTTTTEVAEEPADTTPPAATPRGVVDGTVNVGFVVVTNQSAASEQAGAEGITTIAQDTAVQILVDDLNARGGLGGLPITPIVFEIDATAGVDAQTIARSYCATFTQDNEVYAVLGAGEPSAEQRECLDDAGVPAIVAGGSITFLSDAEYAASPLLVNVNGLSLDSVATSLVEGLDQSGWFESGSTVGVLRLQDDAFDAATANSLLPALDAAGVTIAEEVAIAAIVSQDDIGRVATEAQSAVLRMKDAGVDRLIMFESGGALPFFFMNAAREQQFEPALGFSTTSGGQTLVDNIGTGGTGIGWSPLVDVPADAQPGLAPRAQECFDLLDPTGAAFVTATAQVQGLSFCDIVWLLEQATESGGLADGAGVIAAIESLGDGYQSASLETVSFGPDKHDGVAAFRLVEYDPACACNVYASDAPVPVS